MKLKIIWILIFSTLVCITETSEAQSKQETLAWLNNHGESYLGLLTGLYTTGSDLSVTEYGSVKIMVEDTHVILPSGNTSIKQTFLVNLSQLDPEKIYLYHNDSELGTMRSRNQIKIGCQLENDCISATHEYRWGGGQSFNTRYFSIDLKKGFDRKKAKRLKNALIHAVKLYGGESRSIDEGIFDNH